MASLNNSNSKKGQILLEGFYFMMTAGLMMVTTLGLILYLFAKIWIETEAYLLARAHLYGNEQDRCHISSLWPENNYVRPQFNCDYQGEVTVNTEILPITDEEPWTLSYAVDLNRN